MLEKLADYLESMNPYPETVFPMHLDQVQEVIPDDKKRTSVAGCLCRYGWLNACKELRESLKDCESVGDIKYMLSLFIEDQPTQDGGES